MVSITFKPFQERLFQARQTQSHKRAIWACIAPYLLSKDKPPSRQPEPKFDIRGKTRKQSKPTKFRWRLRSVYLGEFLLFASNAKTRTPRNTPEQSKGLREKKDNSIRKIYALALDSQPLEDWIFDLIHAPSKRSLKATWRKSARDLIIVFKVVSVYLRMDASQEEVVRSSLGNAKRICRAPSRKGDWWKTKRYIERALSRHKASAHIIFGMLQAIIETNAKGGSLPVAKVKHVDELRLAGWKYVTRGIQYATYAQDRLTTLQPKHASGSWLKREELWCLPKFAEPERKPKIRLDKLTESEIEPLQRSFPSAQEPAGGETSANGVNSPHASVVPPPK